MWYYVLVFIGSFIVDVIPFAGPPAWTVMIFFQMKYDLNIWLVLITGVIGSALGRWMLTRYMPWLSEKFLKKKKNEDLQFIGGKLSGSGYKIQVFILLYTLMPLPSTPLFTAAGIARIRPLQIIPAFLVGKFISDAAMILTGIYVANNTKNVAEGFLSWKNIAGTIAGLILICVFIFIDWQTLLRQKKFRLKFNIWK